MVKWDLKALVDSFAKGEINIARLNYGIITLVPKTNDAKQIQKFRPICLLNVSFKIMTKVLMNRLAKCVAPVISRTQTAFIKGRYIMEGVVILHEALNSFHKNKEDALIFKVDFEKAYDKIKWPFVIQMLKMRGFPDKWCDWVMETMRGGHVGVRVNDEIGPYFKTFKGLRQGDAMSPLLFDIAADALAILMNNALKHDLVKGVLSKGEDKGINMLQYADDTIFLIKDEVESVKNLKFILGTFEQMSGLKINFHKSELLLFGKAKEKQRIYQEILTCKAAINL